MHLVMRSSQWKYVWVVGTLKDHVPNQSQYQYCHLLHAAHTYPRPLRQLMPICWALLLAWIRRLYYYSQLLHFPCIFFLLSSTWLTLSSSFSGLNNPALRMLLILLYCLEICTTSQMLLMASNDIHHLRVHQGAHKCLGVKWCTTRPYWISASYYCSFLSTPCPPAIFEV